ncbi:N-acetylmuramoyl-L-alanine amidase [Bacillus toyonensis]|uniref:N-acetylmuramoyl-L-alanine amidase n=1 Tax=Bacillus toyonensis TaxID=155322 RepID=UPI0026865BF4
MLEKWCDSGVKERTDFYVLADTKVPAILMRLGFIDNESDRAKRDVDKIVNSIGQAVSNSSKENIQVNESEFAPIKWRKGCILCNVIVNLCRIEVLLVGSDHIFYTVVFEKMAFTGRGRFEREYNVKEV